MDDSGRGFVYRFPDRDWKLVFGRRAPEVGERVNANGRAWTVVQVRSDSEQRPNVHLEPLDVETGSNTASDA